MSITFENDTDIIIYPLEKIIVVARNTHQIVVAHCIWWLASIIGLEEDLVKHIDKLHGHTVVEEPIQYQGDAPAPEIQEPVPVESREERQDQVLEECEEYLRESRTLRDITALNSKGTTPNRSK